MDPRFDLRSPEDDNDGDLWAGYKSVCRLLSLDNTQLGYQLRRYLFQDGMDLDKALSHRGQRRLYIGLG